MEKDLEFLQYLSNEQLNYIGEIIIKSSKICGISNTSLNNEIIQDSKKNLDSIIDELRKYAGNTIVNVFRKDKIKYRAILEDVCKKHKIKFNKNIPTETLGGCLIEKVISDRLDKMNNKEKENLLDEIKETVGEEKFEIFIKSVGGSKGFCALSGNMILKILTQTAGIKLYYWAVKITVWIFHTILKKKVPQWLLFGLPFVMKRTFSGLFGPIVWIILTAWTVIDIASPAYRVIIPTILYIEALRIISKEGIKAEE